VLNTPGSPLNKEERDSGKVQGKDETEEGKRKDKYEKKGRRRETGRYEDRKGKDGEKTGFRLLNNSDVTPLPYVSGYRPQTLNSGPQLILH
jgi:hypothetical protein